MAVSLRRSTVLGHLLVDARPIDHPTARQRGIGRYVTGLLRGLAEIDAPFTALVGSAVEAALLADVLDAERVAPWSPDAVRERAVAGTWYLATQLMLHPVPLDPIPRVVTAARLPVAAVMYDVIPYRHPEQYQTDPPARRLTQVRAPLARTCDALLAISEFAADTAAAELTYPRPRIAMIGAGVEPQFVPASVHRHSRPDRVLPAEVGAYVVSVTGGDERKNTHGLLRAWSLLPADLRTGHRLVVVAAHSPDVGRRWRTWAEQSGVADEVVFTGAVTDDEMVSLLQGASLAVMPSVEEGFGLPVLEAAACGCPSICSDVSSLPEVLAEPAAGFDPHDPADMAAAIARALTDTVHRDRLLAAGRRACQRWTWKAVATDTVTALEHLGPRFAGTPRRAPVTIAVAGPFEVSSSGIGPYDAQVVDALERRTAANEPAMIVDRLVDLSGTVGSSQSAPNRWPARAFGRYVKPWDVDHLVAVLGSSHHHVAVAELAARVPTHLWLHDAGLIGVHLGLAHLSGSSAWSRGYLLDRLAASRGDRALLDGDPEPLDPETLDQDLLDQDLLDPAWYDRAGITLLGEVLDRARSVIVSSQRALDIVRCERPDGPPALVLPLAHPPLRPPAAPPETRDIVAVGWLDANKLPGLAVDVLGTLHRDHGLTDARLVFVGPTVPVAAAQVRTAADRQGLSDRVEITGRLDDLAYRDRLATARVGLQLRAGDRGEMSAAVTDLLAAGIPTVTTLATAGPSTAGLRQVVPDAAALAAALTDPLADDAAWQEASADALARAGAWTFDDVAAALLDWLAVADQQNRGTAHHVGPDRAQQ